MDLFDEDIAGGAGHTFSFVVGDNSVICPDLTVAESWGVCDVSWYVWSGAAFNIGGRNGVIFKDQKFSPISE